MRRIVNLYRFGTALLAALFTILALWYDLPPTRMGVISALLGSSFLMLAAFPIYLGRKRIALIPLLSFSTGMLLGPGLSLLAIALGSLLGNAIRISSKRPRFSWQQAFFEFGLSILPLSVCFVLLGLWRSFPSVIWQHFLLFGSIFAGTYLLLHSLDHFLSRTPNTPRSLSIAAIIFFICVLPIPITLVVHQVYLVFGEVVLLGLGAVLVIITVVFHRIGITQFTLERHLQELSAINVISKSVSSTLELKNLLDILQKNVTQLLGIDNFFVALLDQEAGELWYPIAVKFGERKSWQRRPRMDRLTDQVIATHKPLLFARDASNEISRIGKPGGEDGLFSWMGVPLISGDATTGCLGVFSIIPRVEFTQADLDFLVTISGQVSVAIENALLYEKAQRRSKQMETLHDLSGQISSSLDLPQVLLRVCKGMIRIAEAPMASIFLYTPDGQLKLEHAEGYSPNNLGNLEVALVTIWQQLSGHPPGVPILVPDISDVELSDEVRTAFLVDQICSWGGFPLQASGNVVGFLSICYSKPQKFESEVIDLLQAFAAQAALAVTNANLYATTDMALANRVHQLAILETIGRRLLAHFDGDRLFEMILDYAIDFTGSPWGFLGVYQSGEEILAIKAWRGYQSITDTWSIDQGITGKAFQTRKSINIPDTSQDSDYIDATGGQPKSQLSVPLIYEDRVLGIITLESAELHAFGQDDQSLVMQLANYAALAVHNAHLYSELQRRLREQSTLYVVTSHLVGEIDPENLMSVVGEAILSAVRPIRLGLYLRDDRNESYYLLKAIPSDATRMLPLHLDASLLTDLIPISIKVDILKIPRTHTAQAAIFNPNEDQKVLIARLSVTGQHLGLVLLHFPLNRSLQGHEIQLLQAIFAQGAIALQNALLFAEFVQARERLSAILNTVEEGILLIDIHGTIVLANRPAAANTGLDLEQTLNTKLHELPAPVLKLLGYTADQAHELVNRLDTGLVVESPKTLITLSEVKPERVLVRFVSPVMSQLQQVIGIMIVMRDITEEHKIQQTREMITDTLVHDLRSPISAVMSALELLAELLQTDGQEGEMISQALRVAQRSSEKVYNLVSSLLEIARMQSGDIDLDILPLNIHDLANDVLGDYTLQANEYGIILTNEIPPDFPQALADKSKIERVLVNLLDNALKFTPGGGKVKISSRTTPAGMVTVLVIDNGPGIPDDYREKIFDRFSVIPDQISRRRGTGLGLAFCRLVIEEHHGEIWVEPNTPFGSIFAFSLPAA